MSGPGSRRARRLCGRPEPGLPAPLGVPSKAELVRPPRTPRGARRRARGGAAVPLRRRWRSGRRRRRYRHWRCKRRGGRAVSGATAFSRAGTGAGAGGAPAATRALGPRRLWRSQRCCCARGRLGDADNCRRRRGRSEACAEVQDLGDRGGGAGGGLARRDRARGEEEGRLLPVPGRAAAAAARQEPSGARRRLLAATPAPHAGRRLGRPSRPRLPFPPSGADGGRCWLRAVTACAARWWPHLLQEGAEAVAPARPAAPTGASRREGRPDLEATCAASPQATGESRGPGQWSWRPDSSCMRGCSHAHNHGGGCSGRCSSL